MIAIDQYAFQNRLAPLPASQKSLLAITALFIVTVVRDVTVACWTMGVMSFLTVGIAKIPVRFYIKLLLAPLSFSLAGVLAILLSFSTASSLSLDTVWQVSVGKWHVFILISDLQRAGTILSITMGAVTSLYFLVLTTPVYELSQLLQKWRVPTIIIELMELMYRFIFLFLSSAKQLYTAEQARLGYHSLAASFRSLGLLIVSLFQSLFVRNEQLTLAMHARNIECFIVPEALCEEKKWNKQLTWILILYVCSVAVILWLQGGG